MGTSNCLAYALTQMCQSGGYLIFRKSPHWWGFQTLWSPDLRTFYVFAHPRPHQHRWYRYLPPLWFRGRVRRFRPRRLTAGTPETPSI